jgi:hypothetical protein
MTDSISGGLEISGRDLTGARFSERLKRIAHWLSQRNVFDLASCAALIALVILAVWTFQDYAISNDEGVQHRYGELIVAYYKSGFTDQSVFKLDNLYLYGGLFDLLGLGLSYIIPVDQYELRHLLCALIGIGGIGAAAATARLIASPRAAFFTIVALALCGSWYGAMYNHTKGIPLAAFMAGAMYFLIRASRALPTPRMRDVIGFGHDRRGARHPITQPAAARLPLPRHPDQSATPCDRPLAGAGPVRAALGVVVSSGAGDRLPDHDCHMAMGCTVTAQSDPRPDIVR